MNCEDRKHRESSLGRLLEAGVQGENWKMGRNWLLYVGWGGNCSVEATGAGDRMKPHTPT